MAEQAGRDPLPDGTADVWWARRADASDRLAGLLDEAERRRWAAFRRPEDRERFLVGCALAKAALARYTGRRPADVRFDRTCGQCGEPHGKPVLEGAGVGPGASTALGRPGTSICSPTSNPDTTAIGIIRPPPRPSNESGVR